MSKQLIKYAKLQTGLFVPNLGDIGTTLPPQKTFDSFEMSLKGEWLLVDATNKHGRVQMLVPSTNVVLAVLGELKEDAPAKAEKNGNKKD